MISLDGSNNSNLIFIHVARRGGHKLRERLHFTLLGRGRDAQGLLVLVTVVLIRAHTDAQRLLKYQFRSTLLTSLLCLVEAGHGDAGLRVLENDVFFCGVLQLSDHGPGRLAFRARQ